MHWSKDKIGLNAVGDELFERVWALLEKSPPPQAFRYGKQIYVRRRCATMLYDIVHEGTHILDAEDKLWKTRWEREISAYLREGEFRKAATGKTYFKSMDEMLQHIGDNYDND